MDVNAMMGTWHKAVTFSFEPMDHLSGDVWKTMGYVNLKIGVCGV
jgi:hypothetical protein